MKKLSAYLVRSFVAGLVILVPVYLSGLLLLKVMKAVAGLIRPLAKLLPKWFPGEDGLSVSLVLLTCFLVGVFAGTRAGRAARVWIETALFERIPGYTLFLSLT